MNNAALTNLWNYIEGLALSNRSKQWLADKLIESKTSAEKQPTPEMSIEQGREEILKGECTTCHTKEELNAFLDAL